MSRSEGPQERLPRLSKGAKALAGCQGWSGAKAQEDRQGWTEIGQGTGGLPRLERDNKRCPCLGGVLKLRTGAELGGGSEGC